jgi:hypothetical protein
MQSESMRVQCGVRGHGQEKEVEHKTLFVCPGGRRI